MSSRTLPLVQAGVPFIDPKTKDINEPWRRFLLSLPLPIVLDVYTPTLTAVANVAASTPLICQYIQLGSQVIVSGAVDVDPTAGATLTQLGISLPVATTFTSSVQCAGTAAAPAVASYVGAIIGDVANSRAELDFTTVADVANRRWTFQCQYQVL